MKTVELKKNSLSTIFDLIEAQPQHDRHLFRGQKNSNWGLVPGLYRNSNLGICAESREKEYDFFERSCLNQFFDEGFQFIPSLSRCYSNDRILAQHFGVPTRFLDWTRDPLVALFFAGENSKEDSDAALFMVLPDSHYLPEEVNSLGPHNVIAVRPPAFDQRIPAQKSMFTFHPYGPPNMDFVPLDKRQNIGNEIALGKNKIRGFVKIVIPFKLKIHLRHRLLQYGIDRRNLFPSLEGVGADIADRAKTGHVR